MILAIADVLLAAIAVALNPIAIVAVVMIVGSPKAKTNGPAFVIGWVTSIVVVVGLVVLLTSPDNISGQDGEPATAVSVIKLTIGLVLLFLAYRGWKKRPQEGESPAAPEWMSSIAGMTPIKTLGLGAMLSGVYPKSLIFNIAAGSAIAQADLSFQKTTALVVVYVLCASVSVGAPVIWYLAAPSSAAERLEGWNTWLTANKVVIMTILLLVFGVLLLGQGVGGLID
jgi:threonine/homoserine/homoserine lactone efflux protein